MRSDFSLNTINTTMFPPDIFPPDWVDPQGYQGAARSYFLQNISNSVRTQQRCSVGDLRRRRKRWNIQFGERLSA